MEIIRSYPVHQVAVCNGKTLFTSQQPFLPTYGSTAISRVSNFKDSDIGDQ